MMIYAQKDRSNLKNTDVLNVIIEVQISELMIPGLGVEAAPAGCCRGQNKEGRRGDFNPIYNVLTLIW